MQYLEGKETGWLSMGFKVVNLKLLCFGLFFWGTVLPGRVACHHVPPEGSEGPGLNYFRDSVCTGVLSLGQPPLIGI